MKTRTAVIIFALLSLIGYACAMYGGYSGGYGGYSSKSFGRNKGVIIPLKTKGFGGGYSGGGFGGGFGGILSFIFPRKKTNVFLSPLYYFILSFYFMLWYFLSFDQNHSRFNL